MPYVWKIEEGSQVQLKDYDPNETMQATHASAEQDLQALSKELSDLQELLAAAQEHSVLVVLQGMDTSGKDGTIRHVLSHINPQGCEVRSFKAPTQRELAHDFLWRIHRVTPARGMLSIFNRSHYEDVLAVRVHSLVPQTVWERRYDEIKQFERLLANNGTILLKFFLHISSDEQERRLLAREQDLEKAWKLSASDWSERSYWDAYQQAYQEALSRCSTSMAPWYIVPANHKWYRNLAIAHTLVETLRHYQDGWHGALVRRGQEELARLKHLGPPQP